MMGRLADRGCLSDTGGEGGPVLSAGPASVGHELGGVVKRGSTKRKASVHPYLTRQMSDFRFRQTLKVRTLGCARRSYLLPTHASSPRKDLKLHEEQHKGHEVYTSSGHRCGVIPYSSVWCVDCLLG